MKLKTNFFAQRTRTKVSVWPVAFGLGLCAIGAFIVLKPVPPAPIVALPVAAPLRTVRKISVPKPKPTALLSVAAQVIPMPTVTPDPSRIGSFRLVGSIFRDGIWQAFFVNEGQSLALTQGARVEKLGEIMEISASAVVVKENAGGTLKTLLIIGEE